MRPLRAIANKIVENKRRAAVADFLSLLHVVEIVTYLVQAEYWLLSTLPAEITEWVVTALSSGR